MTKKLSDEEKVLRSLNRQKSKLVKELIEVVEVDSHNPAGFYVTAFLKKDVKGKHRTLKAGAELSVYMCSVKRVIDRDAEYDHHWVPFMGGFADERAMKSENGQKWITLLPDNELYAHSADINGISYCLCSWTLIDGNRVGIENGGDTEAELLMNLVKTYVDWY